MLKSAIALMAVAGAVLPTSLAFPLADTARLDRRGWNCKGPFQCRTQRIPANSSHACVKNNCSFTCDDGFARAGFNSCVAVGSNSSSTSVTPAPSTSSSPAPTATATTTTTTTTTTTSSTPGPAAVATILPNVLASSGVTSFLSVPNSNAIASWYRASSPQDSTNGHSWCYYPYNDDTPGFAISLATMLANFDGDAMAARKAYCGLEAVVTNPADGTALTLYVADAFDDAWVLTPTSIDVMYNSFSKLFGRVTTNKNDVVKNASWQFTGNRNARYAFNSIGN
ncbi:hypothetical protein JCM11491_000102 [Sporobolomyces phaffii]